MWEITLPKWGIRMTTSSPWYHRNWLPKNTAFFPHSQTYSLMCFLNVLAGGSPNLCAKQLDLDLKLVVTRVPSRKTLVSTPFLRVAIWRVCRVFEGSGFKGKPKGNHRFWVPYFKEPTYECHTCMSPCKQGAAHSVQPRSQTTLKTWTSPRD